MPKQNNDLKKKIDTYLSAQDHQRLLSLTKVKRKTRSEVVREAVRWYLDNHENAKPSKNESELSKNIKNMTDRICGMLARQGAQTGTLYELAWQNHVENKMQERFVAASNLVKGKMRKRLEDDEKAIAERMNKVVGQ
jgi:metal-responsive CopG/Arc/MetJ family transcriptional regulator